MEWLKQTFLGHGIPKENLHHTWISCIIVDSVMKIEKKYYPQICLKECKYKIKKIKVPKFIKTELESKSDLESDSE